MPKAPSKTVAKTPTKAAPKVLAKAAAQKSVKPSAAAARPTAPKTPVKAKTPLDKLAYGIVKKGPVGPVPPQPVKDLLTKATSLKNKVVAALTPGKGKSKTK